MFIKRMLARLFRIFPGCIIISDCCKDTNGVARLMFRWLALAGKLPSALPVDTTAEAGLTLLDMLLAGTTALGRKAKPGIIILNKARRDGQKRWPNGAPFCWFWHQGNLVVTTLDHETMELVQQHLGITLVCLTDISTVVAASDVWCKRSLTNADKAMLCDTQFRSLWYQLLLAVWLWEGRDVPAEGYVLPEPSSALKVLIADNFGNFKTNADPDKLGLVDGAKYRLVLPNGEPRLLTYYVHLAEVPERRLAFTRGSSGRGLLEIVVGNGRATRELRKHLRASDVFRIKTPEPDSVQMLAPVR